MILDRWGDPFPTRTVRRPIGFVVEDVYDDPSGEPVTFTQPEFHQDMGGEDDWSLPTRCRR